jgi:hypothetical protein
MTAMLGSQGEQRMHELMGRRYTGCLDAAGASGGGWMMGAGGAGTGMMAADRHGWSALGIVAVTLGGVALAVLLAMGAVALNRRSRRTPPAAAAP